MLSRLRPVNGYERIRSAIEHQSSTVTDKSDEFYFGYFLQFKVVEKMSRHSIHMPTRKSTRARPDTRPDRRSPPGVSGS